MAIKTIFSEQGGQALANYDYTDIAEGTGIKVFYGGATKDSVSTKYILTGQTFYSHSSHPNPLTYDKVINNTRVALDNGGSYAKEIDLDFDASVFNMAKVIKGTATACIPFARNFQTGDNDVQYYLTIVYKKVDVSSTETDLVSTTSETFVIAGTHTNASTTTAYITMDSIIPQTNFKRGEKLRITLELYAQDLGGTGSFGGMVCYDTQNLVIAAEGTGTTGVEKCNQAAGYTQMKFLIPFKIDI